MSELSVGLNGWRKSSFSGPSGSCVGVRKSTFSGDGGCVGVGEEGEHPHRILIRNTNDLTGRILFLAAGALGAWIRGCGRGEFDDLGEVPG